MALETNTYAQIAQQAWDLFRTPGQRELGDKERRGLETATTERVTHDQILSWPAHTRTQIELCLYHWPASASIARGRVLLVHGWEWQAGRMMPYVQPLLDAGFEVIAYDAPAHGQSGGAMTTLLDYAEAIRTVGESVGGVKTIIGHSFGGMAAIWLLAHGGLPAVERLVSVSAGGDVEYLLQSSARFQDADEALKQAFREVFRQRMGAYPADFDAVAASRTLHVPTLIVHDTRDVIVPVRYGQAFAAAIPGARLRLTSGLGHRFILRDPDTIRVVVDFAVNGAHD